VFSLLNYLSEKNISYKIVILYKSELIVLDGAQKIH